MQYFFYTVICIAILSAFNILTTLFRNDLPIINDFEITEWASLYNNTYTKIAHSNAFFNLNVDFTPVVNWNTNLIFFWITASYKTGKLTKGKDKFTQATVYDGIIRRNNNNTKYHWKVKHRLFEYPLIDSYLNLADTAVEYKLHWEHMPVVGPILKHSILIGNYFIPSKPIKPIDLEYAKKEYGYYRVGKESKKAKNKK